MSDQQRGYAGWPAPSDPRRQPAPVDGTAQHPQGAQDEDPPWFDDGFVAYEDAADEVPWDRPADPAWPEPEADFGQLADDSADGLSVANASRPADDPVRLPGSANRFGTPSSPAYPAPTAAPYAAPPTPPYPGAFQGVANARQPEQTMSYAAAGRPVYAPPVASLHNGNIRPPADPPLRFGNRSAGPAQPAPSPAVPPTSPAPNWEPPRLAPPPAFPPTPVAPPPPVTQPAPARPFGMVDDVADPYDEFAPLANDVAPMARADEPRPAPVARKWTPTPAPPSGSVFGDLFGAPTPPMPRRASVAATPAQAAPAPSVAQPPSGPVGSAADLLTPSPPEPTTPPVATPPPAPAEAPRVDAPPADWPPVPTAFVPQPWASVSKPQTPWAAAQPPARPAPAVVPSPEAGRPAPPQQSPTPTASRLVAPRSLAPAQPAPTPPVTAQPRPAWRAQPAPPSTSTRAVLFVPPLPPDPTRASLTEHATPEELRLAVPEGQPGAQATPSVETSADDKGPSTISTLFWTVMTGVLVVALVLAFLHFLTGVFR